ncbi:DUF541 domain-containing protein [Noviherbaspirillum cavernae]|uniref:DUF541 domain-containing protein n=1 Tax=Noviherbaspirillum cavernae TaxID=2320862 RepID=A0A418X1Q2_9BURK|nr:SIMPL domain-containing protein [Noviherbaspirillum cavernae]RJG06383.1 DUF541 domain-containing protein [Noviherbaspirillum cavernae]
MTKSGIGLLVLVLAMGIMNVHAQSPAQNTGTLVIVPGMGEVKHPNDEARVTFMVEEQDKDKAAAASRVNQKMKQGMEIVKKEDPGATLKTRGYYTYPVYPDDQQRPASRSNSKTGQPASWRVGQYLEVTTKNLNELPKTVAAAQRLLALNGLQFSLSEQTSKVLDQQGIEASYRNLTERVASIAKAMGRNVSDANFEAVDLEGSGAYAPQQDAYAAKAMRAAVADGVQVEEPSFEAGETTLRTRIVGKVRFK